MRTPPSDTPHPTEAIERPASNLTTRRAVLALAGAGAAVAGAWWAWQRQAGSATTTPRAPDVPPGNVLPASFWNSQFDTATGARLALSSLKGHPILLNFWATWCPPCVKEMPELDRFHREFSAAGWRVVGLAIDGPTPVKQFLSKIQVGFDIALGGFGGTELAQSLGNAAGGLPFTVLIDSQGAIRHRKMGATDFAELSAWAKGMP